MHYRTRDAQRQTEHSLFSAAFFRSMPVADAIFDTLPLPREMKAVNWVLESTIHRAIKLTSKIKNTNQFVGPQTMLARDELRQQTHALAIEDDGLRLFTLKNSKLISSRTIAKGNIRRAHLIMRKFDGTPVIAYAIARDGGYAIEVNGRSVTEATSDYDFPFVAIKQPPIGYPASNPPELIILSYKDRSSNVTKVRRLHPITLAPEVATDLNLADALGGVDIAIGLTRVLLRYNALENNRTTTKLLWSDDLGKTFGPAQPIDLSSVPHDDEIPSNASICVDHKSHFHVPLAVRKGETTTLIDVHPEDDLATAAIVSGPSVNFSVDAFPKKPETIMGLREGFGNGQTDGNGMIASMQVNGRLLVANSQSGGYSFPEPVHLNYDMQAMHCFRATECYTRGDAANVVSMDYAFVEADSDGRPLSPDLWIDTWDMPLPTPELRIKWDQYTLTVLIDRDGWFFPGQTKFELYPAFTDISKATFVNFREFALEFVDPSKLDGVTLMFETRNAFFHHAASVQLTNP